ncbi:MAG: hypothetical protein ACREON_17520 [Gemmatimonadaceae bacterium]
MTPPRPGDLKPAFLGLVVSVVFLLVMVFSVVRLTSAKFAGHGEAAAATSH